MVQSAIMDEPSCIFSQLSFQGTVAAEHKRHHNNKDEKFELEKQRRLLEREKREFTFNQEQAEKRMEQKNRLFEMKRKILEEELIRLASEKEEFKRKKEYYDRLESDTGQETYPAGTMISGVDFFGGVRSVTSLKKRYKDLIKIYHPDNTAGDKNIIQQINQEYDELKKQFA